MNNLIEHILNGDYVSANDLFENHMVDLKEKKLYEAKRGLSAQMNEVMDRQSVTALRAKGYKPASEVLGLSPYDVGRQKKAEREKAGAAAVPKRKAAPALKDRPAADRPKTAAPSTGKLKTVDPSVYKPEGLKAKRDRLLAKARELDPRGSTPELKSRESKVKAAYYSAKAGKAIKAIQRANVIKRKVDDAAGRFAGHFGSSWE